MKYCEKDIGFEHFPCIKAIFIQWSIVLPLAAFSTHSDVTSWIIMPPALHFSKRLKLLSFSMRKTTIYCEWPCGCKKPNYLYSTKDHQLQAVTRTAFSSFPQSLETICMTQSALQNPQPIRFFVTSQVQSSSEKRKETRKEHRFLPSQEQNTNTELQHANQAPVAKWEHFVLSPSLVMGPGVLVF